MSKYIDVLKSDNFSSLLKQQQYLEASIFKKNKNSLKALDIEKDSNLIVKNKEIMTTEHILFLYKNISEF